MDKMLGTRLHWWGVFQFTHINSSFPTPFPPLPHANNVGWMYPELFRVSILYRLGSGRELQENFEKDAWFYKATRNYRKLWTLRHCPRDSCPGLPSMYSTCSSFQGTPRRKKKVVHKTATTDDKKLQNVLKKLSVNPIPGIEEVI